MNGLDLLRFANGFELRFLPPGDIRNSLIVFFKLIAPELFVGGVLSLILSPISKLPLRARYHLALWFSVGELVIYASYWVHFPEDRIYMAATLAFGFVFALDRVRMAKAYFSPTGWLLLLVHGLCLIAILLYLADVIERPWFV